MNKKKSILIGGLICMLILTAFAIVVTAISNWAYSPATENLLNINPLHKVINKVLDNICIDNPNTFVLCFALAGIFILIGILISWAIPGFLIGMLAAYIIKKVKK